ncbi:MAG: sulfite exporter TauE/SafE family protein, partial [Patescibacteria group bacterium]
MNFWLIFLTGLTTGGFTCLALQGGLLATAITAQRGSQDQSWKSTLLPTAIFLGAKVTAYTFVGFLLGWLGSMFQLSITAQIAIQFMVGIFMVVTALRMLDVHPIFRRFVLTPPKAVFKLMRNNAKSGSYFSPLILGLTTVFLPCGTTQAMEIQAIGSGNPLLGAATMFAFTMGTAPLFFVLGSLATKFSQSLEKYVFPVAATLVLLLGIFAIDNGLTLAGSPLSLKEFWNTATGKDVQTLGTATIT